MKEFFINYAEGRKELPSKYDSKEEATSDAEITSEEDITDRGLKAIGEALGLFIPKVEGPDIEIIGRAADTLGYSTNKL